MQLVPVEVIQVNSPSGAVRPLRFRVHGRSIDVGRIVSSEQTRSVGGMLFVCECESVVDDRLVRYRLTMDVKSRIWYVSRL